MPLPRKITPQIEEFCREINANNEPIYIDVTPSEQDIGLDCFINVEKRVAEAGGSVQYGWRIWEWSNTLIEAEFHAVWVTLDGILVDPTPTPNNLRRILFLPDSNRVYEGRQVNNIRKALYKHPLVDEFIQLWNEQFEILNKGERAEMNCNISFTDAEALEFHKKLAFTHAEEQRLESIKRRMAQVQMLLSPCPCGSLLRFYRCCGQDLNNS